MNYALSSNNEEAQKRSHIILRDSIAIRREGVAQVALVGAPNAGKSSLRHALSPVQIKISVLLISIAESLVSSE